MSDQDPPPTFRFSDFSHLAGQTRAAPKRTERLVDGVRVLRDEPQGRYWRDAQGSLLPDFVTKLVGISRPGRRAALQRLSEGDAVQLVRDPGNEADSNAVAVVVEQGRIAGHLRRELAADIAPMLDRGVALTATVFELALYCERVQAVRLRIVRQDIPARV